MLVNARQTYTINSSFAFWFGHVSLRINTLLLSSSVRSLFLILKCCESFILLSLPFTLSVVCSGADTHSVNVVIVLSEFDYTGHAHIHTDTRVGPHRWYTHVQYITTVSRPLSYQLPWDCPHSTQLVSWSLTSLFSTNMAISETTQYTDIVVTWM